MMSEPEIYCSLVLTGNLLSAINQLENRGEGTNASVNAEPEVQTGTSSKSVVSEHRRLFGFKPPSSTATRRKVPLQHTPSKRQIITTACGECITVRNTWTRPFGCLSKK